MHRTTFQVSATSACSPRVKDVEIHLTRSHVTIGSASTLESLMFTEELGMLVSSLATQHIHYFPSSNIH